MTTFRCGPLSFDTATGQYHYDGRLIGSGDTLDVDALTTALGATHLLDDAAEAPEPSQVAFEFPTEPPPRPLPPLSPDDSLHEAQKRMRAGIEAGKQMFCACCERDAMMRPRKIHAEMASAIGLLSSYDAARSRGGKPGWHNIRDFMPHNAKATKASSDIAFLVYWDAVARHPKERGVYQMRPKGTAWVEGTLALPLIAWVYGARALRFSTERIMYNDALNRTIDLFGDENE